LLLPGGLQQAEVLHADDRGGWFAEFLHDVLGPAVTYLVEHSLDVRAQIRGRYGF
jgi:hypothetical protein